MKHGFNLLEKQSKSRFIAEESDFEKDINELLATEEKIITDIESYPLKIEQDTLTKKIQKNFNTYAKKHNMQKSEFSILKIIANKNTMENIDNISYDIEIDNNTPDNFIEIYTNIGIIIKIDLRK